MDKTPLYQQIAESIRREILYGDLRPGDRLPSIRDMAARWDCTLGTAQRAYQELAQQGIVISHSGRGTRVRTAIPAEEAPPLRQAALVNRAEKFLLDALMTGYAPDQVAHAVRLALDRWQVMADRPSRSPAQTLRFVGSHDPAVTLIAERFDDVAPDHDLSLDFVGSLGGLIALVQGQADVAGSHLWDEESDTYNTPFIKKLLPGQQVALLTLAHRRLGLIVPAGNPNQLTDLGDLTRPGLRFVNRQRGAGTRVWLDYHLRRQDIDPGAIDGYRQERATHSAVARAIVEGQADVGLGVEAAALAHELDFVHLTMERYDLVIPADVWDNSAIAALATWLPTLDARACIAGLGGYDTHATGRVQWVE